MPKVAFATWRSSGLDELASYQIPTAEMDVDFLELFWDRVAKDTRLAACPGAEGRPIAADDGLWQVPEDPLGTSHV